ncbi:hypothetical protein SAMN05216323_101251 [Williamwhitmania taraxaci]|uniref:Uncharacterized protein n=1 Tax=Williamwhitmania taraxaci TaxID=1640674 RepID=A0A1G6HQL6_9BACT|nr:hypothetical protein SAMN05216323_101251 [Williamwhitmania taraxaci]
MGVPLGIGISISRSLGVFNKIFVVAKYVHIIISIFDARCVTFNWSKLWMLTLGVGIVFAFC